MLQKSKKPLLSVSKVLGCNIRTLHCLNAYFFPQKTFIIESMQTTLNLITVEMG